MDNLDHIQKLLEENLKYNKEIYHTVKKIKRYIFWQRITGIIYLILILAPLILAAIYLPSLIKNVIGPYQSLFEQGGESSATLPNNLLKQLEELQKKMERDNR